MIGRSFLPNEDMGEFQLVIDTPEGHVAAGMEKVVLDFAAAAGGAGRRARDADHLRARQPLAHLSQLKPLGEREQTQEEVAMTRGKHERRTRLQADHRHEDRRSAAARRLYPIQVNLFGPDLRKLAGYALMLNEGRRCPQSATRRPSSTCPTRSCASPSIGSAPRTSASGQRPGRALRLMVSGEDEISSYREGGSAIRSRSASARISAPT